MNTNRLPSEPVVRPRVISSVTGEPILLEQLVTELLERRVTSLELSGGAGYGKTTAINYLKSLSIADQLIVADDVEGGSLPGPFQNRLTIYTTRDSYGVADCTCRLAQWSVDDLIEYSLAAFPKQCSQIVKRFKDADETCLGGNPDLIRRVAERMMRDEQLSVESAFDQVLRAAMPTSDTRRAAQAYAYAVLRGDYAGAVSAGEQLQKDSVAGRLVEIRAVQRELAADYVFDLLTGSAAELDEPLPLDVVRLVAKRFRSVPEEIATLRRLVNSSAHPAMLASVLHLVDREWKPQAWIRPLADGYFSGANWSGLQLSKIILWRADFSHSVFHATNFRQARMSTGRFHDCDFSNANLASAQCNDADFSRSDFSHANLRAGKFEGCDFSCSTLSHVDAQHADFCGVNLNSATLVGGNFRKADFRCALMSDSQFAAADLRETNFHGAKLSAAHLHQADFSHARLRAADLESMHIRDGCFDGADLHSAILSGSFLPGVRMQSACLEYAGLADIDWEGADLRYARFGQCSFHYGSTRSGIVDSPYPSHGTRTGFYTDEFEHQQFQTPEQIRKANLCGADLRGAKVFEADFYLVDLRGAIYDRKQRFHFERCRAILE